MKTRRQYDDEFKRMALELADAKGSLKVTAEDLSKVDSSFIAPAPRSDRSVQYACHAFTGLLKKHPLVLPSMTGLPMQR